MTPLLLFVKKKQKNLMQTVFFIVKKKNVLFSTLNIFLYLFDDLVFSADVTKAAWAGNTVKTNISYIISSKIFSFMLNIGCIA